MAGGRADDWTHAENSCSFVYSEEPEPTGRGFAGRHRFKVKTPAVILDPDIDCVVGPGYDKACMRRIGMFENVVDSFLYDAEKVYFGFVVKEAIDVVDLGSEFDCGGACGRFYYGFEGAC